MAFTSAVDISSPVQSLRCYKMVQRQLRQIFLFYFRNSREKEDGCLICSFLADLNWNYCFQKGVDQQACQFRDDGRCQCLRSSQMAEGLLGLRQSVISINPTEVSPTWGEEGLGSLLIFYIGWAFSEKKCSVRFLTTLMSSLTGLSTLEVWYL